jgi:hypothetical protein
MRPPTGPAGSRSLGLALVLALAGLAAGPRLAAFAADGLAAGAWATYEWRSAARVEVPVLVRQSQPGGADAWAVERELQAPPPVYVTYGIVRADPKSYVLQIVTRPSLEGPVLSLTQVTVDRASGKALRAVIRRPKGTIATPESGLRPFREALVTGQPEEVAVPAGRFPAVRASYKDGTVWVSDRVPAMGLVKATSAGGQLELVRSGTTGVRDLLRS